jgi:amino acid adenylation domain-containing protein
VWRTSPFYREFYADHGIRERQLADLTVADLPFLTKQILMENFDRAVTDPRLRREPLERWLARVRDPARSYHEDLVVVHSSGSSGASAIFAYGRTDWNVMNAVMADRLPPPENAPDPTRLAYVCVTHGHFGGVTTAEQLRATYDVLIISALDSEARQIEQLERFQPHRLTGYSSGIARLAEAALAGSLRIRPKRILTMSDLLTPAMAETIRRAWGAPILNLYGAAESLFLAVQDEGEPVLTVMDDLNILEVLDAGDRDVPAGGTGRVVITNLYNYTLPILRYQLGDTVVRGHVLPSGLGSIQRICAGLAHEALTLDVGGRVVEIAATTLRSLYLAGLERTQFIARGGGVEVSYVARRDLDRAVSEELVRLLALAGASGARVTVRRVPFIAPDPVTGKVRLVVPDTAPPDTAPRVVPGPNAPAALPVPASFARSEIEGSVVARFERQVEQYGDRLAVRDRDGGMTYGELDRAANRIAQRLLEQNGEGMDPVPMLVSPGLSAVTAILGILKAGKFYLPLDPAAPPLRLASILHDTDPQTLLTDSAYLRTATDLAGEDREVVNIEALPRHTSEHNPGLRIPAGAYLYLLFTSGSTGRPKGVLHSHRNALHQIAAYNRVIAPRPDDRFTLLHSHCFSASRLDIFGALLNGAALLHFDVAAEGVDRVADWLRREEITVLHWLPTAFRHLAGGLAEPAGFPRLRWVVLGSEPLRAGDVALFRRHFGARSTLLNRYGTTETGNISCQVVDETTRMERGTAPAGPPIEDVEVSVLDDTGRAVEPGRVGEIVVRSPDLAVGYWRQPELYREAFVTDPASGRTTYRTGDLGILLPDGSLVHAGRKDSQRKVLGYRVEVEETEAVLLAHPGIREAAVAVTEAGGTDRLVAYLVARGAARPSGGVLRGYLRARLPGYMVPSAIIWVNALPHNANGKLDRLALPGLMGISADLEGAGIEPRTPAERKLSAIWGEVLGTQRIGVDDNFFDVGGDSLRAGQVRSRIAAVFGIALDIREFFESPTIAALARLLEG